MAKAPTGKGRLAGKRALVTGGASGFGAGIVGAFVREGARVAIVDLDQVGAREMAGVLGDAAVAVTCDVSRAGDVNAAVKASVTALGGLDIVVNNAGFSHRNQPMLEVDEATYDRVFAVNMKAIYLMARAAVPELKHAGGGSIINVGSTAGIRPRPGLTWYNASKGAVNLVSKSMAVELAPDNIRVNCIAPVLGETALLETFIGMPDTPENRKKFIATIPMGRLSKPADIAGAAVYLASDEAAFLTGVVLEVDGGRCV